MRDTELAAFQSEGEEGSEEPQSGQVLPETPPESLLDGFIPPVKEQTPVAPEHPKCTVQTGDLLVIHVGDEAMEYYGFLILEIYANKLVGINLHNHTYGVRELDSWVEWYEEYDAVRDDSDGDRGAAVRVHHRQHRGVWRHLSRRDLDADQPTGHDGRGRHGLHPDLCR
jgi:hypothetical protein